MGRLLGQREARDMYGGWIPAPPIPPFPGVNLFGGYSVTTEPEKALFLSTVWACVSMWANTIRVLPLQTYRKTDGVPKRITDSPLVLNPTSSLTQSEWIAQLIVSLGIYGNAYGLKVGYSQLGYPQQIVLLDPKVVTVKQDRSTGAVQYLVSTPAGQVDRTADMWHVRGLMTLPGAVVAKSPVAHAAEVLGLDAAARKFALDFFTAGGLPVAVLESDQPINQEQAVTLKERLKAATRNREPAVLGLGAKLTSAVVKPEESQFLETQQTNIARIAQFWNIPAEMVGGKTGSSLTYSTKEMNNQDLLDRAIAPLLTTVESAWFPLLPGDQFVQFDLKSLLRTDAESQAKVDSIDIAAKIIPPSRILARRGEQPLTQAEKEELELVPLTINPGTGEPKALPNPPTPETDDDVPVVGKPPAVPTKGAA